MALCTGRCRHWGVLQQAQPRERLPTIKRHSRLRAATRSLHVRRASHEEGSGTGASYMQLLPLVAPAPNPSRLPACSFKAHQGAPYEDPAKASRAATHRFVLLHQSEWV